MGMGTWGLIGGVGKAITDTGAAVAKYGAELEELKLKKQARLDEIRAEYAERDNLEMAKEKRTEQRLQDAAKQFEPMFKVDATPKTQDNFQKAKPLIGGADQGPPDELQGPPELSPDTEAFGKYQKDQDRGRSLAQMAARRPEAIDDIQKAANAEKMSGLLDEAIRKKDWTAVTRISAAIKGEGLWGGAGSGLVLDKASGDVRTTDVSDSIAEENRADRDRSRAGSTNDHAKDVSGMAAERVKQLQDQYRRVESETFKEPKNTFDPAELEKARSKWEEDQARRLREIGSKLDKAEREYDRVYGDLSARRGIGSGAGGGNKRTTKTRSGERPPLTAFEN